MLYILGHFPLLYSYYYCKGQTIFCCLHLQDTSFQMGHDWERTAPAFNCTLAETHRHNNRMYSHDQHVQGVKSIIWFWNRLHQGEYYIRRQLVLSLKLIPIGLSFWFSRFCTVIPTICLSISYCNAWRNRSFNLARKWLTGSISLAGGRSRITSCVPVALKWPYCRVIVSLISNLRTMVWKSKGICAVTHWILSSHILLILHHLCNYYLAM